VPGRLVLQAREAAIEGADSRRQRRRDVEGPALQESVGEEYKGIVEYRPNFVLTDVDVATKTAKFDVQDSVKGRLCST
jgi:hypothetical protein